MASQPLLVPTPDPSTDAGYEVRHWTRAEYERLVEAAFFGPEERLELIQGEVIRKLPLGGKHATALAKIHQALGPIALLGTHLRQQSPSLLGENSVPEPDAAVIQGEPDDYPTHPSAAHVLLVVEVSESSLPFDQKVKTRIYCAAGIKEYCVVY